MATTRPAPRPRRLLAVGTIAVLASIGIAVPATAAPAPMPDAPTPDAPHTAVADTGTAPTGAQPPDAGRIGAGLPGAAGSGASDPGGTHLGLTSPAPRPPGDLADVLTVIDTDERGLVDPTTSFPARAVVQIIRITGDSTFGCTGWLYGPNIIATAGHCVHPGEGADGGGRGGFYPRADLRIVPGRNGTIAPYGTCGATQLLSVKGWTQRGDETYDYGAIRLGCAIGETTGWFGLWWQNASLTGETTTIAGYPCDKRRGEQWRHAGESIQLTDERQLFYRNDTFGCQSGSPVYRTRPADSSFCTGPCVMAIHAYGLHGSEPHSTYNHGTRITESVYDNLLAWRNAN